MPLISASSSSFGSDAVTPGVDFESTSSVSTFARLVPDFVALVCFVCFVGTSLSSSSSSSSALLRLDPGFARLVVAFGLDLLAFAGGPSGFLRVMRASSYFSPSSALRCLQVLALTGTPDYHIIVSFSIYKVCG